MDNKKIQMWALNISCYNCTIDYIPGPQNVMADLLSRLPEGDSQVSESKEDSVEPEINDNTLETDAINSSRFNPKQFASYQHPARKELEKLDTQLEGFDMVEEQEQDTELKKQRDRIKQGKAEGAEAKRHIFFDDILYYISNPNDHLVTRMDIPKQL